jgi:hypothetical protein
MPQGGSNALKEILDVCLTQALLEMKKKFTFAYNYSSYLIHILNIDQLLLNLNILKANMQEVSFERQHPPNDIINFVHQTEQFFFFTPFTSICSQVFSVLKTLTLSLQKFTKEDIATFFL